MEWIWKAYGNGILHTRPGWADTWHLTFITGAGPHFDFDFDFFFFYKFYIHSIVLIGTGCMVWYGYYGIGCCLFYIFVITVVADVDFVSCSSSTLQFNAICDWNQNRVKKCLCLFNEPYTYPTHMNSSKNDNDIKKWEYLTTYT